MSAPPNGAASGPASIPLIEIGSFAAPRPDRSEFIGSASGVFFANTVFRAFASLPPQSSSSAPGPAGETDHASAPDPGSVHSHLVATEGSWEHNQVTIVSDGPETSGARIYGVSTPGLGLAPSPTIARKLLMLYFRLWHPFFPFLHGPSFVNHVNQFYDLEASSDAESGIHASSQARLCRAVIFQCIFNIAASTQDKDVLQPSSRIQSASALTSLLGVICENPDIYSLQALLAMTLYLTTTMSLRAASTAHGALTRVLYHSGFHRCPYRYIQLPRDTCDIRQRIFWSAYILDRQLSQALGHPTVLKDSEIDVCIPGMMELHKPVGARESPVDVQNHLPKDIPSRDRAAAAAAGGEDIADRSDNHITGIGSDISIQSPAHQRQSSKDGVGEYALGYLVTYWRLVGTVLDLFHRSIHNRSITWEMVLDITSRAHSWWNGLPTAFQDNSPTSPDEPKAPFGDFFSVLYSYLVISIHRPFLSLPTHRMDFRHSLQTALGAARSILQKLAPYQHRRDAFILAWPGTLSAAWMAGLVVVYAGRLELYPFPKADAWVLPANRPDKRRSPFADPNFDRDLSQCLALLETMNTRWNSAGHCHAALNMLREKLRQWFGEGLGNTVPTTSGPADIGRAEPTALAPVGGNEARGQKRRRVQRESTPAHSQYQNPNDGLGPSINPADIPNWQPILQYIGPDFGFDADILTYDGEGNGMADMNGGSSGLFNTLGWENYMHDFGDRFNL